MQTNQNIIRQDYPSEYTKSARLTNGGQQPVSSNSQLGNQRSIAQTFVNKSVQKQGSGRLTVDKPIEGQFDKLFNKLSKAQENLIGSITFHKKQIKMLEDNMQTMADVRSALES